MPDPRRQAGWLRLFRPDADGCLREIVTPGDQRAGFPMGPRYRLRRGVLLLELPAEPGAALLDLDTRGHWRAARGAAPLLRRLRESAGVEDLADMLVASEGGARAEAEREVGRFLAALDGEGLLR